MRDWLISVRDWLVPLRDRHDVRIFNNACTIRLASRPVHLQESSDFRIAALKQQGRTSSKTRLDDKAEALAEAGPRPGKFAHRRKRGPFKSRIMSVMIVSLGGSKTSLDFRHLFTRSRHHKVSMVASPSLYGIFDCRPPQVTGSQSPVHLPMDRRGTHPQSSVGYHLRIRLRC